MGVPRPQPEAPRADAAAAEVVDLPTRNHRWWSVIVTRGGHVLLAGLASDAVWQNAIANVPCPNPDESNSGPCSCGLHAPAAAAERARSIGSLVAGGGVRVLSNDRSDESRPRALMAVEGPLRLMNWCAGAGDGFTLERCRRSPRWVIPGHPASSVCTRHLRRLPQRLRRRRIPTDEFMEDAAASLHRRYGVDIVADLPDPDHVAPVHRRPGDVSSTARLSTGP